MRCNDMRQFITCDIIVKWGRNPVWTRAFRHNDEWLCYNYKFGLVLTVYLTTRRRRPDIVHGRDTTRTWMFLFWKEPLELSRVLSLQFNNKPTWNISDTINILTHVRESGPTLDYNKDISSTVSNSEGRRICPLISAQTTLPTLTPVHRQ